MLNLTDKQVVEQFYAAGIPATYHSKEKGLHNCGSPNGAVMARWIQAEMSFPYFVREGRCMEIAYDNRAAMDEVYYLARAFLMKGTSVIVVTLGELAAFERNHFIELAEEHNVLVIPGFMGQHWKHPLPEEVMMKVEWNLRLWMLDNKSLVVQGEVQVNQSTWWSPGFRSLFYSKKEFTWSSDPKTLEQLIKEEGKK